MKKLFLVGCVAVFSVINSCSSIPQTTAAVPAAAPVPTPAPVKAPAPAVKPATGPDELDAAIRETSNYLNKQLPKGNKLVILNIQSDFPALSEYIIDELIANAVNDRIFSVVDRQQLNTIRAELNFHMSGEVDDSTAQALGRMAGAQIIISGAVSRIGDLYRLRVRALSVQSAQITGQFNRNIPNGPTVSALVSSKATGYGDDPQGGAIRSASPAASSETATRNIGSGSAASGPVTNPASSSGSTGVTTVPPAVSSGTTSAITGIMVPGNNLTEKFAWLQRSADSHNTYILEVSANESIAPYVFEFSGGINITVVLRGIGANRTIRLQSHGTMFTVRSNVTFILDNNLTLQGHSGNSGSLVKVDGGIFKMNNGSAIIGNGGY